MSDMEENYINFFNYYNYSDFSDIKLIENRSSGKIYCARWKNTSVTLKVFNIQESALESFKEVSRGKVIIILNHINHLFEL